MFQEQQHIAAFVVAKVFKGQSRQGDPRPGSGGSFTWP
jgi:hypothetical protein